MSKIKISDILQKQFVAAGDTQNMNGNEGIDAVYTVNRRWLNNFAKLIAEAVIDKCAEGAEIHTEFFDERGNPIYQINRHSILKIKQEIDYS